MADKTGATVYKVVINHEEQYMILPESKSAPIGYKSTGVTGSKEDCLAYVQKVWSAAADADWQVTLQKIK